MASGWLRIGDARGRRSTRTGARGARGRSAGRALAAAVGLLLGLAPRAATADWLSENFEVHGRLTSKAYFVTPNFNEDLRMNSWRTEAEFEGQLRLVSGRDFRMALYGILKPTYEAIFDLDGDHFGADVENGAFGAFQDGGLGFFPGPNSKKSQAGKSFPGMGAHFKGRRTVSNIDLVTELTGDRFPGFCIDTVAFFGCVPAPVRARGKDQPKIGGAPRPSTFTALLGRRSLNLAKSLSLADAAGRLDAPLSPLGNASTLNSSPVDVNRTESQLKFDCGDNAHPWCFVRELYAEIEWKNTFVRVGKQQVVWGKTDVFRMQDIVNPLDLGVHNVIPPLEEASIPQLALDVIQSFGDVGPLEDFNIEFVWNFDRFLPIQLGQCGEPYTLTFACEARADALGHGVLGIALAEVDERHWKLSNTEIGARIEFRTRKPSIAWSISGYWGFQDLPAVKLTNLYSTSNPNPAALLAVQGLLPELVSRVSGTSPESVERTLNSVLAPDGSLGLGPMDPAHCDPLVPIESCGFDPFDAASLKIASDNTRDLYELLWASAACPDRSNFGPNCFPTGSVNFLGLDFPAEAVQALGLPWSFGENVIEYPRVFTLGGSLDYQIPGSDTILRMESAFEFDRVLINTTKPDWTDKSNVVKGAIGLDRFTFIPFLNRNRAAFLSVQTFAEHILDYDDGTGTADGIVQDKTSWISTFFMQNYWRNDSLVLTTIFAYDWNGRAWLYSPTFRWVVNESWFVDVGLNAFGGKREKHNLRDLCADATTSCLADPDTWQAGQFQILNKDLLRATETALGWFRESFADRFAERRDEVWIGITYQF